MRINVCLSSDDNYAKYLGVTIISILKNAKKSDDLYFYILNSNILKENIDIIEKMVLDYKKHIKFLDTSILSEDFKNCKHGNCHISVSGYYRFMIAELLKDIDKVIYLDCDLFVEKSLSELFKTNIKDYYIGAVEDVGYVHWRMFNEELIHQFHYINSGVLLINAKKWREDKIGQKLLDYAIAGENIGYGQDQPVINVICKNKCKHLDYKWNVQDSFYRPRIEVSSNENKRKILRAAKHPAIIHFTGPLKPWLNYVTLPKGILYLKYLEMTPWKGQDKLPSYARMKKELLRVELFYKAFHPLYIMSKEYRNLVQKEKNTLYLRYATSFLKRINSQMMNI